MIRAGIVYKHFIATPPLNLRWFPETRCERNLINLEGPVTLTGIEREYKGTGQAILMQVKLRHDSTTIDFRQKHK